MDAKNWVEEFGGSVTVCDAQGTILELNQKAAQVFNVEGGKSLIGANVFDCHPPQAREKLRAIMENRETNCYTIEKKGVKKLIYQAPWYKDGQYSGFVELSLVIPAEMAHFKRS